MICTDFIAGLKTYLAVPHVQSLVTGHCQIVPFHHVASSLHLDEDIWAEVKVKFSRNDSMIFQSYLRSPVCRFQNPDVQLIRLILPLCI